MGPDHLSVCIGFLFLYAIQRFIVTGFVREENNVHFGNFVKNAQGFVLKKADAFLTRASAQSDEECMIYCLNHAQCFSLNVALLNTTIYECELFGKTDSDVSYLVARSNAYYMKLQVQARCCVYCRNVLL